MAKATDMVVDLKMEKSGMDRLDFILKEVKSLREEFKVLKMNILQINSLKMQGGRV
jgi:hypothetical protein